MPLARAAAGHGPSSSELRKLVWPTLAWAGLVFAFAPSLRDSAELFWIQPWSRATLVFPVLAYAAARAEATSAPSRWGWVLVAVGIAVGLLAVGSGLVRAGRFGFVLAAIGLCRGAGWCSLWAALLLGFLLPLPHALLELASPGLEDGLAWAAAQLTEAFGVAVAHGRAELGSGAMTLPLAPHDGGLGLAVSFVGLAWFEWLCRPERNFARLAGSGLVALLAAGGVQLASLVMAAILLGRGGEDAAETARAMLDRVPWFLVWISGMALAWKTRRADQTGGRESTAVGVSS